MVCQPQPYYEHVLSCVQRKTLTRVCILRAHRVELVQYPEIVRSIFDLRLPLVSRISAVRTLTTSSSRSRNFHDHPLPLASSAPSLFACAFAPRSSCRSVRRSYQRILAAPALAARAERSARGRPGHLPGFLATNSLWRSRSWPAREPHRRSLRGTENLRRHHWTLRKMGCDFQRRGSRHSKRGLSRAKSRLRTWGSCFRIRGGAWSRRWGRCTRLVVLVWPRTQISFHVREYET